MNSTSASLLKDKSGNNLTPSLPPVSYFKAKDKSLSTMQSNYSTSCSGVTSSTSCIFKNPLTNTPVSGDIGYKQYSDIIKDKNSLNYKLYQNYTTNSTNAGCEMANVYTATGTLPTILSNITTTNTDTINKLKNTVQYLSCQVVKARTKQYDLSSLMTNKVYSLKDIFKNYSNAKIILAIALFITLYILVNGTFEMVYYFYAIIYYINNRVLENLPYDFIKIGFIIFIILTIIYLTIYFKAYNKLGNNQYYDITCNIFPGSGLKINRPASTMYWFVGFITVIVLVSTLFLFNKISQINSVIGYIFSSIVFIIIISLLYLFSIKNLSNETTDNKTYIENTDDSCQVKNTMNFSTSVRKIIFWLTVILTIITVLFIRNVSDSSSKFVKMVGSVIAMFTIPFIVLFNWFIGISLFFAYPFIIVLLRFVRYFYENITGLIFGRDGDATVIKIENKKIQSFDERLSASWSLIFGTLIQSVYHNSAIKTELTDIFSANATSNKSTGNKRYNFTSNKQFTSPILNLFSLLLDSKNEDNKFNFIKNLITIIITLIIWVVCFFGIAKNK